MTPTPQEDLETIAEALRHPTREVRPSDAACSRLRALFKGKDALLEAIQDPLKAELLEVLIGTLNEHPKDWEEGFAALREHKAAGKEGS